MLSLMVVVVVDRGVPSRLMISLLSLRVKPFFVDGALGGGAAAGAGFGVGGVCFFLCFLATVAQVGAFGTAGI